MKKPVIICVDDEIFLLNSLRETINTFLNEKVYTVIAESGPEALELIKHYKINGNDIPVIISDYIMPEMKGDVFLREAHKLLPKTKKILLTGQATLEGVRNAINWAELYRFIVKPWDNLDLELTITEAFRIYYKERLIEIQHRQIREVNNKIDYQINDQSNEFNRPLDQIVDSFFYHFQDTLYVGLVSFLSTSYQINEDLMQKFKRIYKYATIIINDFSPSKRIMTLLGVIVSLYKLVNQNLNIPEKILKELEFNEKDLLEIETIGKSSYQNILTSSHLQSILNNISSYLQLSDSAKSLFCEDKDEIGKLICDIFKLVLEVDQLIKSNILPITSSSTIIDEPVIVELQKNLDTFNISNILVKEEVFKLPIIPKSKNAKPKSYQGNARKAMKLKNLQAGMIVAENVYDNNGILLIPSGQTISEELLKALNRSKSYVNIIEPIIINKFN
jgi:response regulator RpfG family c-di-GMP phosphodiesterase